MIYLKLLRESFLFAFEALRVNRLRTFLSLLGITIGIFTIVSIFSGVDYMKGYLNDNISKLGTNVIYVNKWPWVADGDFPWWKYIQRPQPSLEDFKALQSGLKNHEYITYTMSIYGKTVKRESNHVDYAGIIGVSYQANKTKSLEFSVGRYFNEIESDAGRPVCIIGHDVADGLFPNQEVPLGKEITIMGKRVTVIGVFAAAGSGGFGPSIDRQIYVPLNFARLFANIKSDGANQQIIIKGSDNFNFNEMVAEVRAVLRNVRRLKPNQEESFSLNNPTQITVAFKSLYEIMDVTGRVIGGFSILVGGFGIANIMFVSVKERTPIIGIQKSIGAKNYFILLQFLVESVLLCLLGGIIGILIAYGITALGSKVLDINMTISNQNIILALSLSIIIGIISGFWPAYLASRMDPVEAIRS